MPRLIALATRTARSVIKTLRPPTQVLRATAAPPDGFHSATPARARLDLVSSGQLLGGWLEVDVELPGSDRDTMVRLWVDGGNGFLASGAFLLPLASHGHFGGLCRLPPVVRALRLEVEGAHHAGLAPVVRLRALSRPRVAARVMTSSRVSLSSLLAAMGTGRTALSRLIGEHTLVPGDERSEQERYRAWVARHDTLDDDERAALATLAARLSAPPTFSVLMPVFDTPQPVLERAIASVRSQLYPRWELCIVDDASTAGHVGPTLAAAAAAEPRIKVTHRQRRGGISEATNTALAMASGEFIALVDHDDELAPHALACMAAEVAEHPRADLLYSDEDKLDESGQRCRPYFKPDFNPELLWSQNFFCHLGVYRTSLVREVGGFRPAFDGSQDHDLVLRCAPLARSIRHVPRVLYHWRMAATSTAASAGAKPHAVAAARQAVLEHVREQFPTATVEPGAAPGTHRVRLPVPPSPPLVSIIIPTRDAHEVLGRCLDTLTGRTRYRPYELVVVDNRSRDREGVEVLARRAGARVVTDDRPFNYAAINNGAVAHARGEILAFLNNDVEVITPEWLDELVSHALRPGVGAVGARLLYPDGRLQHGGVVTGLGGTAGHVMRGLGPWEGGYHNWAKVLRACSAVTGACLVIARRHFEAVGGFDEAELGVAFNDVDLCLRLGQRGLRTVYSPHAELFHHESYSRGSDSQGPARERFLAEAAVLRRRYPALDADPYFNPNLSLDDERPTWAFPPRLSRPGWTCSLPRTQVGQ